MSIEKTNIEAANRPLSIEARYQFVTSQLVYCNEKILQSFTFFIKLVSTLSGGFIWLRLQPKSAEIWSQISGLAILLLALAGFGSVMMIYRYVRTWWGFRQAESELTNGAVPPPRFPYSCQMEIFMMLAIAATTAIGGRFLQTFH